MGAIFEDFANDYDLFIPTPADWTVDAAALPNGSDCVHGDGSIAVTYNINGDDFDFRTGDWTVEFWVKLDNVASARAIVTNGIYGGTLTAEVAWQVSINASEQVVFTIFNTGTGTGAWSQRVSAALSTAAWHYVVCQKANGVDVPTIKVDDVASSSASSGPTGTATAPTSSFWVFLGTNQNADEDVTSGLQLGKVAIYDSLLSGARQTVHYNTM